MSPSHPASAASWIQHQSDAGRTGVSAGARASGPDVEMVWKTAAGSPEASAGQAVFGSSKVYVPAPSRGVVEIDARTGVITNIFPSRGLQMATAAVRTAGREVLIHGSTDGTLRAVDLSSGTGLWTMSYPSNLLSSPVVTASGVIYAASVDGTLIAIDAESGGKLWETDVDGAPTGGVSANEAAVYTASAEGEVISLDAGTGSERWRVNINAAARSPVVVTAQSVIVPAATGAVWALDPQSGTERWRVDLSSSSAGLAAHAGVVYVAGENGAVAALDESSGTVRWQTLVGEPVAGGIVVAADVLILSTRSGRIVGLNAAAGSVRWQADVQEPLFSGPAIEGNRIVILSNLGQVHALDVKSPDRLAPRTALTIGEPKRVQDFDSAVWVTPSTPFRLTAEDDLSVIGDRAGLGVDRTSVSIDGGAFSVKSESFVISDLAPVIDGRHTVSFFSVDLLGNVEETRTIDVLVDAQSPATDLIVGLPSLRDDAGRVFVTSSTPIDLSAVDTGFGVARTEFSVDGAPFAVGDHVTLAAAEGEQTVLFRSVDLAGQIEPDRQAVLIVDNTSPSTQIAFDLFNETEQTVIPQTQVSLTAQDGGKIPAGVSSVFYQIDTGPVRTYAGPFTLEDLPLGPHSIRFYAEDALGNSESPKLAAVSVVQALRISHQAGRGAPARLLVWLNYRDHKGNLAARENLEIDRVRIEEILSRAGLVSFKIVTSEHDFKTHLRSGDHNGYLILGNRRNAESDETIYDEELRERVRLGEGLVASFWRAGSLGESDQEGRSVLGISPRGGTLEGKNLPAVFVQGGLTEDTLVTPTAGKSRRTESDPEDASPDARIVARVDPKKSVGVSNRYFDGRTVYLPFDLGASIGATAFADTFEKILQSAFAFTEPQVSRLFEGQQVTVRLDVVSPVSALFTVLLEEIPAHVAVTQASDGADTSIPGRISWQRTVPSADTAVFRFTLRAPDGDARPIELKTTASYLVRGNYFDLTDKFVLRPEGGSVPDLVSGLAADLRALAVLGKEDKKEVDRARRELEKIIDLNLNRSKDAETAIRHATRALHDHLFAVRPADAAALESVRAGIDTLLIVLERRYALAPADAAAPESEEEDDD